MGGAPVALVTSCASTPPCAAAVRLACIVCISAVKDCNARSSLSDASTVVRSASPMMAGASPSMTIVASVPPPLACSLRPPLLAAAAPGTRMRLGSMPSSSAILATRPSLPVAKNSSMVTARPTPRVPRGRA